MGNRFRHGCGHIGSLMEAQLHERRALHGTGLHVVNAANVQEVILVIIHEVAFHLGRVHAAIRLRHVDDRFSQVREDIHLHALNGED